MTTEIVYTSKDQYADEYESDSECSVETLDKELERRVTELLATPVKKEDNEAVSDLIEYLAYDLERGWHRHIITEKIAQNYVAKKKGQDVVHNRVIYVCTPTKRRKRTWGEWFRGVKQSERDILFTRAVSTPGRETLLCEMLEDRFRVFVSQYLPEEVEECFQWELEVSRDDESRPTEIRVTVEW